MQPALAQLFYQLGIRKVVAKEALSWQDLMPPDCCHQQGGCCMVFVTIILFQDLMVPSKCVILFRGPAEVSL